MKERSEDVKAMLRSLTGLSVGDALGENWKGWWKNAPNDHSMEWSDDTAMAISIVEELITRKGLINQEFLADRFAQRYLNEPGRGYGPGAKRLLKRIAMGDKWRVASKELFKGEGSFGNGAAMRVAPLGAFCDSVEKTKAMAEATAEITHAHVEGRLGAIAVALAAYFYRRDEPVLTSVIPHIPEDSLVGEGIRRAVTIEKEDYARASSLGVGSKVSAQDTVPFCLWLVENHGRDFEKCLRLAAMRSHDRDTVCAIVGGILAANEKTVIPQEWQERTELIPSYVIEDPEGAWGISLRICD